MDFGINTTPSEVFEAIEARVATAMGLGREYVILSLWDVNIFYDDPPVNFFTVIKPKQFTFIVGITSGMSPESKAYDMNLGIEIWVQLNTDTYKWDQNYLKDANLGALSKLNALLSNSVGLEQYTPLNADGQCILKEPMRNVGFTLAPRKQNKAWGVIETFWSVQFCYDVS